MPEVITLQGKYGFLGPEVFEDESPEQGYGEKILTAQRSRLERLLEDAQKAREKIWNDNGLNENGKHARSKEAGQELLKRFREGEANPKAMLEQALKNAAQGLPSGPITIMEIMGNSNLQASAFLIQIDTAQRLNLYRDIFREKIGKEPSTVALWLQQLAERGDLEGSIGLYAYQSMPVFFPESVAGAIDFEAILAVFREARDPEAFALVSTIEAVQEVFHNNAEKALRQLEKVFSISPGAMSSDGLPLQFV